MNNVDDFDERGKVLVIMGGMCIYGWLWGDIIYIMVFLCDLKYVV